MSRARPGEGIYDWIDELDDADTTDRILIDIPKRLQDKSWSIYCAIIDAIAETPRPGATCSVSSTGYWSDIAATVDDRRVVVYLHCDGEMIR